MMNELALFAGAGLGLVGTHHLLGWQCVGYVEMAEYPCKVLEARIKDGLLSKAPIFQMHTRDFIRLGYAEKYRGVANVVTAGFPCQPFSLAGNRLSERDERNGWPDTIEIIRLVRPSYILLENVAALLSSGYFGTILSDLAQAGYDATWSVLSACAFGAPHTRERLFIMAYTNKKRSVWGGERKNGPTRTESRETKKRLQYPIETTRFSQATDWWKSEPVSLGMATRLPNRMDRLEAIGNGQVPVVVAAFWRLLTR